MRRFVAIFIASGCAAPPLPPKTEPWEDVAPVPADRPICGWEEVDGKTSISTEAAPGESIVIIAPEPSAAYGDIQRALKPAETTLVRVKLAIDRRWLLPTTYPLKVRQPPKPPPEFRATRVVGHRKITRDTRRPAERIAALRVKGDRLVLFVENEPQAGEEIQLAELLAKLAALDPPAQVFTLTATDDTPWASVQNAAVVAACFDRKPGDEPHEIIMD